MLSIVIPSYKNARILDAQLPGLMNYLSEKKIEHEIIIVDDGSNDNDETKKVAQKYNCIFIQHAINKGKGAAVREGMLKAKGEFRIFTDADIPFDYSDIEKFLFYLNFKEYHIVVGDRNLKESRYYNDIKGFRKLGSKIFTLIVGRFVVTGLFDTQCGLKGFRANIAQDIFSCAKINRFASDVEWLYIALKRNYDIKRLPVQLRNQENSSINLLIDGPKMLVDLFKIKLNHLRGYYN